MCYRVPVNWRLTYIVVVPFVWTQLNPSQKQFLFLAKPPRQVVLCVLNGATKLMILLDIAISMWPSHRLGPR